MNTRFAKTSIHLSLFACAALLSLSGCKKEDHAQPTSQANPAPEQAEPVAQKEAATPSKAELAAKVAVEISQTPEQADAILAKHGMDREGLEALIFEIAKDPKLRDAYNRARQASLASR